MHSDDQPHDDQPHYAEAMTGPVADPPPATEQPREPGDDPPPPPELGAGWVSA